jgi:hypothetical protein
VDAIPSRDLFGTDDPVTLAEKKIAFDAAVSESFTKGVNGETQVAIPGVPSAPANPLNALEGALADPALAKSIDAGTLAAVQQQVQVARSAQADIVKDFTLTSPLSSGLVPFDLEAPAKLLTPRPTPLRNKIPRKKGIGTSHRYKRITGFTGTGTGGVGVTHPGIVDTTQTSFANSGSSNSLYFNRGGKISYAADEATVLYVQNSVSDQVPWSAQFSGQGFQDIRALSAQTLLYSSMLLEERLMLFGRGTGTGYVGAVAAPGTPTGSARTAAAGETAISGATTNIYVKVTSDAGDFGQSTLSSASAAIAVSAGQVVDITIPSLPATALGARIYVSTGASDPGDASRYYIGRTGYNTYTVQGTLPTSGTAASAITADTSAYAAGYDGIMPIVMGSNSGYNSRLNAAFSTANPGNEYQTAFYTMYNSVKADPDEILMAAQDRKQLSDALKVNTANNYRLTVKQDELGGVILGDIVSGLLNESTGKIVNLTVHPWMPQGNSAILSYSLPIPDTQVSDVWSVYNVQDYLGVQWPVNQFAYEASSYWYGTFVCYAPAWNGSVNGIKAA